MLAYHNDKAIQKKYIARVMAHQKADEIAKGFYWEGGKGCAVGCTIHGSNHKDYETELGIPEMLARLEDRIFEGLPDDKAKLWPARFLKSIKVGVDLSLVGWKFQLWLQMDNHERAVKEKMPEDVQKAIAGVLPVLKILAENGKLTEKQIEAAESAWSAARSAAWSAAWSAARSAAWSARSAWSAAESGWSAESAARSAAWSARSAARSAAWSAAYEKMADQLIKLIKEA